MHNPHKVGLVFGAVLGGLHAAWSVAVLLGVGQMMVDFIFWAHMIHIPVIIGPFEAVAALTLVVFTAVVGYIIGYVGTWVWNKVH